MKYSSMKFANLEDLHSGDLFKEGPYRSIREMLERVARLVPDSPIFRELDGERRIVEYTAKDLYDEVCTLGDGLLASGFGGKHIAICATNSCRYLFCEMAISTGVGVAIPVDRDASAELLATLLSKCDADAVICSEDCLPRIVEAAASCPRLKDIITIDRRAQGYQCYNDIIAAGRAPSARGAYRKLEQDLSAPAKILFTSGTTGINKGVVLTGANLAANMMNCIRSLEVMVGENTSMSVLPMHHATEINTHIMARVATGDVTYINDSMRSMMNNIRVFQPTVITVVPMIANAFYKNIWLNAKKQGKEEKLRKGIKLSNFLRRFGIDITHKLFKDIYVNFGGKLKMIVCGGSMLNPVVVKGLNDIGIRIENGYGITECGPLISINSNTLRDHLSVGRPCSGLEARIADPDEDGVGELCIRGKSVAAGYYNDPEATRAAFGEDGFFNTGDSARMDKDGRIFLVGRKKNTIVLQNGKNVCPEEVENVFESALPYANDIVVYQAEYKGNEMLCMGLYIEDEAKRADRKAIASDIAAVNAGLPPYKRIDYVELAETAYPRTSTRKIKRDGLPKSCSATGFTI